MAARETGPEEQRLTFRIGVNLGDIVIDGDDILGDGVNVAARLETLAPPGGLCISRAVHDQVRGKLDAVLTPLGPQPVKNLPEPVEVWRVEVEGVAPTPTVKPGARPVDCRPALRQHVARCRPGLPRRRHRRGRDQRAEPVSRSHRDRPQLQLQLSRPSPRYTEDRAGAGRALRRRGLCPRAREIACGSRRS